MAAATAAATADPSTPARARGSPWSHVVRGEPDPAPASLSSPSSAPISIPELQSVESPVEDLDSDASAAGAKGKKPAWNKPSNGLVEAGPVMGAVSWPALGEATRASPKSSSSDSLKSLSDGSASAPVSVVVPSQSKLSSSSQNPNHTQNHAMPARQKSMKQRSGGSSGHALANGGLEPLPPLPALAETPQGVMDKHAGPKPSPKDLPNKHNNHNHNNWDHGPRGSGFTPLPQGDHHRSYHGGRRNGNGGSGPQQGGYLNRRDHERGGYDWNSPRGLSGRDGPMQPLPGQRGAPRAFMRAPPPPPPPAPLTVPPYIPPPPLRPYMSPIGLPEMHSIYVQGRPTPETLRSIPLPAPVAPPMIFYQPLDSRALLLKQIEYYFSTANLCKDTYLRQKMDDQGWVPVSLIAGFNKVKQMTNDIQYILDTIRVSNVVEVQGDRIRKRHDWMTWLLPSPRQFNSAAGPSSPETSNYGTLVAHTRNLGLEESDTTQTEAAQLKYGD
ncbi:putative la-type HTH domain, winged helix-like DNA-binding domain superfamily [Dioscorea sansibarensis]